MKNGTYKAKSQGFHPAVTVTTTIENNQIKKSLPMELHLIRLVNFLLKELMQIKV